MGSEQKLWLGRLGERILRNQFLNDGNTRGEELDFLIEEETRSIWEIKSYMRFLKTRPTRIEEILENRYGGKWGIYKQVKCGPNFLNLERRRVKEGLRKKLGVFKRN